VDDKLTVGDLIRQALDSVKVDGLSKPDMLSKAMELSGAPYSFVELVFDRMGRV
jgi:hypothetical protein